MKQLKWEEIPTDSAGYLFRTEIHGGWLVKQVEDNPQTDPVRGVVDGYYWTSALTFVPDINHEWEI